MKHVGIFDAKTHLSRLVEEVENGNEIVITRHGRPVAKLVKPARAEELLSPEATARRLKAWHELRKIGQRLGIIATQEEIKSWIEEGRH